ncbi:gliding motility lipoprotein GldH [Parapedobacter soli]|uniref:gliding motility lipoprotein GldH n=1 Tax=Parapedobacter soli TaxID=416955 RepID=UPI0021C8D4E1|nr:gliding motility lipoprotein GldH [Parapedobacter soli]
MRLGHTVLQLSLSLVVLAASCTDTAVLDKNMAIADNTWYYDNQPELIAHITDNTRPYNIYLNLRHTPDYRYSNIFVLIHRSGPAMADTTARIELPLAEPDGRWLGRSTGSMYAYQQLIDENVRFPDTGQYYFIIEQNMRENPLREITDVGIRIEPMMPNE